LLQDKRIQGAALNPLFFLELKTNQENGFKNCCKRRCPSFGGRLAQIGGRAAKGCQRMAKTPAMKQQQSGGFEAVEEIAPQRQPGDQFRTSDGAPKNIPAIGHALTAHWPIHSMRIRQAACGGMAVGRRLFPSLAHGGNPGTGELNAAILMKDKNPSACGAFTKPRLNGAAAASPTEASTLPSMAIRWLWARIRRSKNARRRNAYAVHMMVDILSPIMYNKQRNTGAFQKSPVFSDMPKRGASGARGLKDWGEGAGFSKNLRLAIRFHCPYEDAMDAGAALAPRMRSRNFAKPYPRALAAAAIQQGAGASRNKRQKVALKGADSMPAHAQNGVRVTIRVDRKLKENAEALFDRFGMNMTTALNVFLRKVVEDRAIPFKIGVKPDEFAPGHSSGDISSAFAEAVQSDIAEKQRLGFPVARYDAVKKRAYIENADGLREYVNG
jgi:addiction module RelB/DinJ family antitoxin